MPPDVPLQPPACYSRLTFALLASSWLGMFAVVQPALAQTHAQAPFTETAPDPATLATWRQRWGFYLDMVGVPYVNADWGGGGRPAFELVQTASWKVPGESMLFTNTGKYPGQSTLRWDEVKGHLVNDAANVAYTPQPDGTIVQFQRVGDEVYRYTGRMGEDRTVEYLIEKQQGGTWTFFNRIVQVPAERLAAYQANNPIPTLEAWVGKRLVSAEGGRIIQLNRGSSGPWSLDVFLPNGQLEGRFEMGAARKKPTDGVDQYDLTQVALNTCDAELPTREDEDVLVMEVGGVPVIQFRWECGKLGNTGFKGQRMFKYSLRPAPEGLQVHYEHTFLSRKYESSTEWDRMQSYVPVTDALLAKAEEAYAREQEQARLTADARREEQRERNAAWSRKMGAVSAALGAANEVAAANEAESRASLDATLAEAARRARLESATQAQTPHQATSAQRPPASLVVNPSRATGAATRPAADTALRATSAGAAPGGPLRFVLNIGLQPRAGDRVNPTCYSTVITRPGPPGWGQDGLLPDGSARSAYDTVQSFKSRFIAACKAASGRDITSEGNFRWTWNETSTSEQQLSNSRARASEDVTVSID